MENGIIIIAEQLLRGYYSMVSQDQLECQVPEDPDQ